MYRKTTKTVLWKAVDFYVKTLAVAGFKCKLLSAALNFLKLTEYVNPVDQSAGSCSLLY